MPIYELAENEFHSVHLTTFSASGIQERSSLQRALKKKIEIISPGTLIIAEEFGDWDDSRRRIDLLGLDKEANLVVIELKRSEDGGFMDLQSLRYAAMVSKMTFDKAVDVYRNYSRQTHGEDIDAQATILEFLEWDKPNENLFAQDVRIILASAEFSKELTSSVLWLINHDIDITCVRLRPYRLENRLLVDVQQIIPLPEAADYQVKVREKAREERQSRVSNADRTLFNVKFDDIEVRSQAKRNAIFFVCKNLCKAGVNPEDLLELLKWKGGRVWYVVEGKANAADFEILASRKAAAGGPSFDVGRWFCDDDQLVQANEKTYALSKMWGGENWLKAMTLLKDQYPKFRIEFLAVE